MKKLIPIILITASILSFLLVGEILTRVIIEKSPVIPLGDWHINSQNKKLIYELDKDKFGIFDNKEYYVNLEGRRENYNYSPIENTEKIAFVGDSYTFGHGVSQEDTLPKQFGDICNKIILNYGVLGYNLEQEIEIIKTKVLKENVSDIFVVFVINDAGEKSFFGRKSTNHVKAPIHIRIYSFILDKSRLVIFMKSKASNIFYKINWKVGGNVYESDYQGDSLIRFEKNLKELSKLQSNNLTIYYVIYPEMGYLNNQSIFLPIYNKVEELAKMNNLTVINLFREFEGRDAQKLRVSMYDMHPNKDAHKIAAEKIKEVYAKCGLQIQ